MDVLDGISWDRIVNQLNDVLRWPEIADQYVRGYLAGDLEALRFWGRRFDARPRPLVSDRDRILFERMVETLRGADGVDFVGFPHVPGICHLFRERGARIRQGLE